MTTPADKPTPEKRRRASLRKTELAVTYLQERVLDHMRNGSWGTVTIAVDVQAGFVKGVTLGGDTVVRDVPDEILEQDTVRGLTRPAPAV